MSRKRPPTQRSKSRGSHGAKAKYKVHRCCVGCNVHQPIARLNADKLCQVCVGRAYGQAGQP